MTKKKKSFEDDGRQVADMSGTYNMGYGGISSLRRLRKKNKLAKGAQKSSLPEPEPLTKRETRKLMINALLAGLLIGTVFIVFALIFILFAINVWFK